MERRKKPRTAVKERVIVTELGAVRTPHVGLLVEVAENSLTAKLVTAIERGTPVEVEAANTLVLGEVLRCEPAEEGYRIALSLRYSLDSLKSLEKLNRVLQGKRVKRENLAELHIMRE